MTKARPATIVAASLITIAMAVVTALVAAWELISTWGSLTAAEAGTDVYFLVCAAILLPASFALRAGRGWGRGVVATAHLLLVFSLVGLAGLLGWLVLVPGLLSVTVLASLATPSARAWILANRRRSVLFSEDD